MFGGLRVGSWRPPEPRSRLDGSATWPKSGLPSTCRGRLCRPHRKTRFDFGGLRKNAQCPVRGLWSWTPQIGPASSAPVRGAAPLRPKPAVSTVLPTGYSVGAPWGGTGDVRHVSIDLLGFWLLGAAGGRRIHAYLRCIISCTRCRAESMHFYVLGEHHNRLCLRYST